jgi:serine/threonine protein kinase
MQPLRPDTPRQLVDLIDRALSPDPGRRLSTIEELRDGLRDALDPKSLARVNTPVAGVPVLGPPRPTPPPGALVPPQVVPRPRRRWIGIASAIAITLGVGAAVIALVT